MRTTEIRESTTEEFPLVDGPSQHIIAEGERSLSLREDLSLDLSVDLIITHERIRITNQDEGELVSIDVTPEHRDLLTTENLSEYEYLVIELSSPQSLSAFLVVDTETIESINR